MDITLAPSAATKLNIPSKFSFDGLENVYHKAHGLTYRDVQTDIVGRRATFDVSILHPSLYIQAERHFANKPAQVCRSCARIRQVWSGALCRSQYRRS